MLIIVLALVEGKSGSGKSAVSKYMETCFGFDRHAIDEYISFLIKNYDVRFSDYLCQVDDRPTDFWGDFDAGRTPGSHTAVEIMDSYHDDMKKGVRIPDNYAFDLQYFLWDAFLKNRADSVSNGNNVVMEAFADPKSRSHAFTTYLDSPQVGKDLIRLYVNDDELIRRLTRRGYDTAKAKRDTARPFDFNSIPDVKDLYIFPAFRNEIADDLVEIKRNLRQRYVRKSGAA